MTNITAPATLALAALLASGVAASADDKSCFDQFQQALASPDTKGSPEATLAPYTQYYQCLGKSPTEARAFALLRVQLAQAGEAYLAQTIKPSTYRGFIVDRQRKIERMRTSPELADAIGRGDADGDLVPDTVDLCPKTAPLAATDDQGCDLKCPAGNSGNLDAACAAQSPVLGEAEGFLDPLVNALVPINLACTDATPDTPALFAWGPRRHVVIRGRPPRETIDTTAGWYFTVRRTAPEQQDCETWYALQFVFRKPLAASTPPLKIQSVLFSSKEDETATDEAARFPVMTTQTKLEGDILYPSVNLPLSYGRRHLRDALAAYSEVSIRVRAITGANRASAWSEAIVRSRGPEIKETIELP